MGAAVGASLGLVTGQILAALKFNKDKKEQQTRNPGRITGGDLTAGNPLAALASGVHQQGRADVAQALRGGGVGNNSNPLMTASALLGSIPYAGAPFALGHAGGSVSNYMDASDRFEGRR